MYYNVFVETLYSQKAPMFFATEFTNKGNFSKEFGNLINDISAGKNGNFIKSS